MIKIPPVVIVLVSFALVPRGSWAAPASAAEVAEPRAPDRVVLVVEHDGLLEHQIPEAAERAALFVREDSEEALRDVHGVEVVEGVEAPALIIRLAWVDYDKSIYHVEIATRRPGREPVTVTSFDRHFFPDTALSEGVAASLSDALADLAEPEREGEAGQVAEEGGDSEEPTQTVDPAETEQLDTSRDRVPLGTMGKAGIGVLAAGALATGVGVGLVVTGRTLDEGDGQPYMRSGRDYRRPGIGVLVSGGVLLATGAVLLGIDRTRAKERKQTAVRVFPTPGGLQIFGRF